MVMSKHHLSQFYCDNEKMVNKDDKKNDKETMEHTQSQSNDKLQEHTKHTV